VYPLTPLALGGSREEDELRPVGEYAMSALGRERMFEHFSRTLGFPLAIVRLNYATELRYGVLVDLAERVNRGEPIDLAMGNFNAIGNRMQCRGSRRTGALPARRRWSLTWPAPKC